MPGFRGHLIGGAMGYGLLLALTPLAKAGHFAIMRWLLCVLAGSLFPDIDTKSMGQKIFYRFFLLFIVVCIACQKIYTASLIAACGMIPLIGNHRGICHNPLALIALAFLVAYGISTLVGLTSISLYVDAAFFLFGAYTHLVLDRGVAAFSTVPSRKKKRRYNA